MNNLQTSTLSKKTFSYTILDAITVDIEVNENPYLLPLEELFTMAARINKKRSFLFVSKVLGKHLPIDPQKGLLTAALLAARYLEKVKGIPSKDKESLIKSFTQQEANFQTKSFISKSINPVVIGFAETATALGHAFFDCFEQAEYFHTTREEIPSLTPCISFEEEHSHATSHRCYIPLKMIANEREIILVDDEMTTGKTAINIIQSIHEQFPRNEYTVVSILDWRSEENQQRFVQLEKSLGVTIHVVSLLSGSVQVNQLKNLQPLKDVTLNSHQIEVPIEVLSLADFFTVTDYTTEMMRETPFIAETGRFGLLSMTNNSLHRKIVEAADYLKQFRTGIRTLCLGTGEFMYIPMKLAAEMGKEVNFQSTTRSPIYIQNQEGYGARHGFQFANPEDSSVTHFVYNIPPGYYDEIFIFFERKVDTPQLKPLLSQLKKLQVKSIKIVFFSQ